VSCRCGTRCSQRCDPSWGKLRALARGVTAHTNTKFASFFFQAIILIGDKLQTPNHCGLTDSLEIILLTPSFPPSLLSPYYSREIFLLILLRSVSRTSSTQPDCNHPRQVGSKGRLTTAIHFLLWLGSVRGDRRLAEGGPRGET